ncbi:MAG: hypothetical protein HRT69_15095 [Flavobacteriaceae bacterium]|nr:hypothetical protein [Flavobacteriaceae bacterium]
MYLIILYWNKFNITKNKLVYFNQPNINSIMLNKVIQKD